MGKKARKTRWRTLNIDEQSDSEESTTANGTSHHQLSSSSKVYHQHKSYYTAKFPYSSQSTPTRRYAPSDAVKSTRSSSTASETKVTFNEDEYTRITTPRQDVLFKKGYLNKPKNYQTQTSTGTSTTSTSNSTGNGTPDHQSADGAEGTDLEYESQFVFPNGFVDQNGIYYINSYEPYPLVVYNTAICYPEYARPKRHSTGSLTESMSPNNEETSGGETANNGPELAQVYNVLYPGFYYNNNNGTCSAEDEQRRIKKKRRRKLSKTQNDNASECSDECESSEAESERLKPPPVQIPAPEAVAQNGCDARPDETTDKPPEDEPPAPETPEKEIPQSVQNGRDDPPSSPPKLDEETTCEQECQLKPDAEEFVPRAYRQPLEPVHFVNVPPNFVPIPIVPPPTAFLPPGIPVNFITTPPPANFVNFVPKFVAPEENKQVTAAAVEQQAATAEERHQVTPSDKITSRNDIDIEKIVSKLEEAAREQRQRPRGRFQGTDDGFHRRGAYAKQTGLKFDRRRPKRESKAVEMTEIQVVVEEKLVQIQKEEQKRDKWPARTPAGPRKAQRKPGFGNMCPRFERGAPTPEIVKKVPPPVVQEKTPKSPSQWIAVSRKKRKNKSANDDDDEFVVTASDHEVQSTVDGHVDLFESYDVSQLVDVVPPTKTVEEVTIEEVVIVNVAAKVPETVESPKEEKEETSKTRKPKRSQKPQPPKRLLITDSYPEEEEETPVVVEEKKEPPPLVKIEEPTPVIVASSSTKTTTKKKRKKPPQLTKAQSISSSSTTINLDDSYDFLLDTSALEDADEKTNVEISQELDRMIQKGIYNSLEEKIRSLDVALTDDDGFFRTLRIGPVVAAPEKNGFFKPADFSSLLRKAKSDEPQPSTSTGIFLENPKVNEILKDVCHDLPRLDVSEPPRPRKAARNKSKKKEEISKAEKRYPITQAVKEWMTKTRENTPEVEILKSPSAIFKEFCEEPKNGPANPRSDEAGVDEDVTVFAAVETERDLLECWDNDLRCTEMVEVDLGAVEANAETLTNGKATVDEGEDVLEVYESKYGKNEDFLQLQAELEEKKASLNVPKHNNLPYRAICCSVM